MKQNTLSRSPLSAIARECSLSALLMGALVCVACGSKEESDLPWEEKAVTYRAPDGTVTESSFGDDCGDLGKDECKDIQDQCGDKGTAEVYLDESGDVLEVICLPPAADVDGVVVVEGGGAPPETGNKDVIVLSGDADSPAIVGDLELDGNNVAIYGEDPETSVLDGNLSVTKNNAFVYGITITGDLHVTFNDATFGNCVIKGNVILDGNNAQIVGCTVEGNITITGNNNVVSVTKVGGTFTDEGQNTVCEENETIADGTPICE